MSNSCLVSVIIPVYASERHIEQCARSLMDQSMQNGIEFIFVNDCSPDRTMDILQSVLLDYPSRKDQITVINHSRNLGAVQSRKDGALVAKGEYVLCCDHDDWMEKEMVSRLYEATGNGQADMVECGFFRYRQNKRIGIYLPCQDDRDFPDLWNAYLWIHLIRKDLFLSHYDDFLPCKYCEDVFPLCYFYYYAKEKRTLPVPLYHHVDNPDSITHAMDIAMTGPVIQKNFSRLDRLYRSRRFRKTYHKFLFYLKYSARSSFHSSWQFYWTFRKSSLFIPGVKQTPARTRFKMFFTNNLFPLFVLQAKSPR